MVKVNIVEMQTWQSGSMSIIRVMRVWKFFFGGMHVWCEDVVSPWYSDFVNLSNSAVHLSYEALDCGLVISFYFFFPFFFLFWVHLSGVLGGLKWFCCILSSIFV